jgi:hypothetical protein
MSDTPQRVAELARNAVPVSKFIGITTRSLGQQLRVATRGRTCQYTVRVVSPDAMLVG